MPKGHCLTLCVVVSYWDTEWLAMKSVWNSFTDAVAYTLSVASWMFQTESCMSLQSGSTNFFPFAMANARGVLAFFGCSVMPVGALVALFCGLSNHTVRQLRLMRMSPWVLLLLLSVDASCDIVVFVVCERGLGFDNWYYYNVIFNSKLIDFHKDYLS